MNIGDKVRMLHGKEEGIITRFMDNKLVEIEIEDKVISYLKRNGYLSIGDLDILSTET